MGAEMKRGTPLGFTPPITRVHNIFRIRTVVNAVTAENKRGVFPNDKQIGIVLAESGLSKYRKEKIKDRIMRRARDHLLTASYMGLLTRVGRPLGYSSTTTGKILEKYGAEEECPKDAREEAVFIDKILRLKLTNVYDLQRRKQYLAFRSRPCLYILHVLEKKSWLHEHQIALATGSRKSDPLLEDRPTRSLISKLCRYYEPSDKVLHKFYRDFGVRKAARKNMTRNIRPLLDWCESVGLVSSKEVKGTRGRWYEITDRGRVMLKLYGKKTPIWYVDLGKTPEAKAALLIFYQYAAVSGFDIKGIMNARLRTGLVTMKVSEILQDVEEKPGIILLNRGLESDKELDFTLEYDVPPENRNNVLEYLKTICNIAHVKLDKVVQSVEVDSLEELETILEREQQNIRSIVTGKFAEKTAISSDPLLKQVSSLVPSIGILGQYRSDFEKEVVILLRLLGLNAIKYQGQLADRCRKTHIMRFFENNPDILIINGIESLVECKSSGEWKAPLSGTKSVPKELLIYQQYFAEVKSNSVIIIYEGLLDINSHKIVASILEDTKDIVFVSKNYLINCVHQPSLRERFLRIIMEPKNFKSEERILVSR